MLNRRDPADVDDDEEDQAPSPFTRPGFLVSAAVVAIILVLGVIVLVRANATNTNSPAPAPVVTAATPPATPDPTTDPAASVCGLAAPAAAGGAVTAPVAAWLYEGTTAYPTSPEYGPGKTSIDGYRYCFQHSRVGAVFTTANALAVPSSVTAREAWARYFVSSGPNSAALLDQLNNDASSNPTGIRVQVTGFRLLSYTDSSARVDLAVSATGQARTVTGSYVYELVWRDGDWKLNSDSPTPFNFSTTANPSGYTQWSS